MIKNNLCRDCWHQFVCDKLKILAKFDDDQRGSIGIDITMDRCRDFAAPDLEDADE